MAVGVAKPNAQGHAITKTDTAIIKENSKVCPIIKYHITKDSIAIKITAGTK